MEPSSPTAHAHIEELLAHADWVRALARNLSRDDADADDLAQETWLATLRGAPPRRPGRAWLGGVTRNLSKMRWRASGRRVRHEEGASSDQATPATPDDVVARMEMQRLLADAVLRLEEPWRSTVVQRYLDGRTSAEIARREGVPPATVRGRLKAALERLRVDLDERHEGRRDVWRVGLAPVLGVPASQIRTLAAPPAAVAGTAALALGAVLLAGGLLAFLAWGRDGDAPPAGPAAAPVAEPDAPTPPPEPDESSTRPDTDAPHAPPDADAPDTTHESDPNAPSTEPEDAAQPALTRRAVPRDDLLRGAPPGMVGVPAGTAVIGTTDTRLRLLLTGRSSLVQADFAFEAPQHRVEMKPYFIDRYEVTNAQYLLFLQDTARASYDTDDAALADLEEVAGHLLGVPRERWDDDVAWGQLYESNKSTLWEKMPGTVVKNQAGEVDEKATKEAFHHAPLVRGLELAFYDRKPPETWPAMDPPADALAHPVTSISYDDAEAFAEWAGKHVPTEQEWEYAGRGPDGFLFPWGDEWFADVSHVNWGAQNIDAQFMARTMRVATLPEGRSWCGAHHLLGNAAEWTSSWFGPYPGNEREHQNMGEYVKVIRGATFMDLELLVLRLAARNYIGQGIQAPPRPGNRYEYVGFRCAWYEQPGLDQLGPILRRVSRGRRVTRDRVALDRYAGAVATRFSPPGAEVQDHVTVIGASQSVVLIPLTSMLRPDQRSPRIDARAALERVTARAADPLPLAVVHTALPLEKVYVRRKLTPAEAERRRRSRRILSPPVKVGTCLPGTYVLGVWHTRLCLCTESLEFVCFLTEDEAPIRRLDLLGLRAEEREAARLDVDAEAGTITLGFDVPVGGAGNLQDSTVVVEGLVLTPRTGTLSAAGPWHTHSRADD